jgi:hypothetical protein
MQRVFRIVSNEWPFDFFIAASARKQAASKSSLVRTNVGTLPLVLLARAFDSALTRAY